MGGPCLIAVGDSSDPLARQVTTTLRSQGTPVRLIAPGALGRLRVSLRQDTFYVDDCAVGAIFAPSLPQRTLSNGFVEEDRSFCDAETGAAWLAACHLESILAINRYDPVAWFEKLGWTVWRRKLMGAGIPVSPFAFGDASGDEAGLWYPYTSGLPQPTPDRTGRRTLGAAITMSPQKQVSLVVCDEIIAGDGGPTIQDAVRLLGDAGVRIAGLATDFDGRLLAVTPHPAIPEGVLDRATDLLVRTYDAHLHHW